LTINEKTIADFTRVVGWRYSTYGFFGHGSESFFDAIEWNADKVGVPWLPPVGRPGSIMVSRTCDIGHVILGAGYPPKVRISIMLADSKSLHMELSLSDRRCL